MEVHDRDPGRWRMPVTVLLLVVLVVLVASASMLWPRMDSDKPPVGPPEKLKLATSQVYLGSAMVQLARERGYFEAEGLELQIEDFPTGKAALQSVVEGRADLATATDLPIVFAILHGEPVSIVGTLATSDSGHGVVARKDRGIVAPADLKGRRIGLTSGTSAHFWCDAFLLRQHVVLADVHVQPLPTEKLAAALVSGEVDAVCTWQPYLGKAQEAVGDKGVLLTMEGVYDSPWHIAGTTALLAQRPEAVRRLLRALLRAERAYAIDRDAALASIATARGIGVAALRAQMGAFRFALRLDQSLLGTLEDQSRWALRSQVVAPVKVPNFLDHVYTAGLAAVEPTRVSIIR